MGIYAPPPGQNTTPDPGFFSVKEYIQQIVYESSTTDSNIQPVPINFAILKNYKNSTKRHWKHPS